MVRPHACVGVACSSRMIDGGVFHAVFEQYLQVFAGMRIVPVTVPVIGLDWPDTAWTETLLAKLDGLFLPGSPSNVHPSHYGGEILQDKLFDPARDATMLPLIRAAVDAGMPVLAVCRGFQELNVALGGSLNPDVERDSAIGHRARWPLDSARRYDIAHPIQLNPKGRLRAYLTSAGQDVAEVQINSLHAEGIDSLAPDLRAEAFAPDGLIEAASHRDPDRFVLGVQWHAEWRSSRPRLDDIILSAFENACLFHNAR